MEAELVYNPRLVWDKIEESELKEVFRISEEYKHFLSVAKTERLAVKEILRTATQMGFSYASGEARSEKFYKVFGKKSIALVMQGETDPDEGINLIVSHIDSPRLDLKQRPLYEDVEIAHLKTHYYGGLKKYQWVSRPLALHGVVILNDGSEIIIAIGDSSEEPVFTVSDISIHLAGKIQMEKKIGEAIEGEKLNLICGSIPVHDKDAKERIKLSVLTHLYDTYGITEEDFISAEIEAVPAGPARDVGFDRSLVGSYGQDDRACAFASLRALFDVQKPKRTCAVIFLDKEEIGSEGVTSAKSKIIDEIVLDILSISKGSVDMRELLMMLSNSRCISADVNGALDPDWQEVHDKTNAARIGYGVCISKFTGSKGKSGASDASAELVAQIRRLFKNNNIVWQYGELGKVDEGGGGTIAMYIAERGIDVIDVGPVLLNLHSPFEISSKADIYMSCKAFRVFLEST